jgi:hypothetical protein
MLILQTYLDQLQNNHGFVSNSRNYFKQTDHRKMISFLLSIPALGKWLPWGGELKKLTANLIPSSAWSVVNLLIAKAKLRPCRRCGDD